MSATNLVADAIRSSGRLAPLTEEQKQQRRIDHKIFREQQAWQSEQRKIEHERIEAEREATARHEAAIERAELNRKQRLERSAEIERKTREIELRDLRMRVTQQGWWQKSVENAAHNAVRQQNIERTFADIDALLISPQAEQEPEEVIESDPLGSPSFFADDYNPNYWRDRFEGKTKR